MDTNTKELNDAMAVWQGILDQLQKAPNVAGTIPAFERYVQSGGEVGWVLRVETNQEGQKACKVVDQGPGGFDSEWRISE